jgi:hypothetical protein
VPVVRLGRGRGRGQRYPGLGFLRMTVPAQPQAGPRAAAVSFPPGEFQPGDEADESDFSFGLNRQ